MVRTKARFYGCVFWLLSLSGVSARWCKGTEFQHGWFSWNFSLGGCTGLDFAGSEIRDSGAQALAAELRGNTELTVLSLAANAIGEDGFRAVAEALRSGQGRGQALSVLSLASNEGRGSGQGARTLVEAMRIPDTPDAPNTPHTDSQHQSPSPSQSPMALALDISSIGLGERGASSLAEALVGNSGLVALDLASNAIGMRGARALAAGLQGNTALTELDLSSNGIGDRGALALAEALAAANHSALTWLDLSSNGIGDLGARALARALSRGGTLARLSLGHNRIGDLGAEALAVALRENNEVMLWGLEANPVGGPGAVALADAAGTNDRDTGQSQGSGQTCDRGLVPGGRPSGQCSVGDCRAVEACLPRAECRPGDCSLGWLLRSSAPLLCKGAICNAVECCEPDARYAELLHELSDLDAAAFSLRVAADGLEEEIVSESLAATVPRNEFIALLLAHRFGVSAGGHCSNFQGRERGHCEAGSLYAAALLAALGVSTFWLVCAAFRRLYTWVWPEAPGHAGRVVAALSLVLLVLASGMAWPTLLHSCQAAHNTLHVALLRILQTVAYWAQVALGVVCARYEIQTLTVVRAAVRPHLQTSGLCLLLFVQLSTVAFAVACAARASSLAQCNALCHLAAPSVLCVLLGCAVKLPRVVLVAAQWSALVAAWLIGSSRCGRSTAEVADGEEPREFIQRLQERMQQHFNLEACSSLEAALACCEDEDEDEPPAQAHTQTQPHTQAQNLSEPPLAAFGLCRFLIALCCSTCRAWVAHVHLQVWLRRLLATPQLEKSGSAQWLQVRDVLRWHLQQELCLADALAKLWLRDTQSKRPLGPQLVSALQAWSAADSGLLTAGLLSASAWRPHPCSRLSNLRARLHFPVLASHSQETQRVHRLE